MRKPIRLLAMALITLTLGRPTPGPAQIPLPDALVVEPAPDWTALFNRTSGWTGADGIYSIPLDGTAGNLTLFVFSDTFIGEVDSSGQRLDPTVMVNNTAAVLTGAVADPGAINFLYRTDATGSPLSLVVPATPAATPDNWYWLGDGVAIGRTLHVFGLRMKPGTGGDFNFATAGVNIISLPIAQHPGTPTQIDTPLFLPADDARGDIIFGAGILDNTAAAGAPFPDGYIYIYGTQNDPLNKKLVAARVHPESFLDFSTWEYMDDQGWGSDINRLVPLTSRVSNELSVSPLPDGSGRFVLVFQEDAISRYISLRIGQSPIGPWGGIRRVYSCPEVDLDPDIFTYNAKAHPHLSGPGELLISYNVNSFDFWDHFRFADIYRPRFIRISLAPQAAAKAAGTRIPAFGMKAFPNPFNPRTEVAFDLPGARNVRLSIHDVVGRRIRTLLDGYLEAGPHTVAWNGRDDGGRHVAAGVYICRIMAGDSCGSLRLTLVQ